MNNMINYVIQYTLKVGPHAKKLEENKNRIYELSRQLPAGEGYELMKLFDSTVEETKKLIEKQDEVRSQKDE